MVTRKQGCRDESETREEELGEDPEMGVHGRKRRSGEDPGEIHRSVGVQCSGVSEEKEMREGGRVTVQRDPYPFPWSCDTKHVTSMQPGTVS